MPPREDGYSAYTDGGCSPNPGPGGWGVVLVAPGGEKRELSGGDAWTTNNRMELTAAVEALRAVPSEAPVTLITDSLYLKKGVTAWLPGWRRKGWRTADGGPVKNRDLWEALDVEVARHRVDWRWTRGHSGDPFNERADRLAASHIPAPGSDASLPLGDREAVHAFVGVAFSAPRRRGAWEVVLCHGDRQWTVGGGVAGTTANRLLLLAALDALEAVERSMPVHVYTGATYLAQGASEWLPRWKRSGWRTRGGEGVANAELWRRLDALQQGRRVSFHAVGSNGAPAEMEAAKHMALERLGG
jgi:ribonuclease HI